MSVMNLIIARGEKFDIGKKVLVANQLVEYCLKENIGIMFNYDEYLYKEIQNNYGIKGFYFNLTDNFCTPECDEILEVPNKINKESIFEKYNYFEKILNIISQVAEIEAIDIFISSQNSYCKEDYFDMVITPTSLLDSFYNRIILIANKDKIIELPTIHFKILNNNRKL